MRNKLNSLLWTVVYWPFYVLFAILETSWDAIRNAWEDAWGNY